MYGSNYLLIFYIYNLIEIIVTVVDVKLIRSVCLGVGVN